MRARTPTLPSSVDLPLHRYRRSRRGSTSRQKFNIYHLLSAAYLLGIGVACDATSPVNLKGPLVPDASRSVTVSGVTATVRSWSEIDLSWPRTPNASGYQVFRSITGGYTLIATTTATVTSYANTGLSGSIQYCYQIRSFKIAGRNTTYSAYSGPVCATTPAEPVPPPAPSYSAATAVSSSAVTVTWGDNSGVETGFRVERSATSAGPWTAITTTAANVTSITDSGLASEQQVCYRVVAFNSYGESAASNAACAKTVAEPTPLAGPTNLTAVAGVQGIDLAWTDNSTIEEAYVVHRSLDGVTFGVAHYLAHNTTSYHDGTALSNTTYWYKVVATRDDTHSDFSNVASAVGSCVPTAPTEVCDNGVDDDCDGLVDLGQDPDCGGAYDCPCQFGYTCNLLGFCEPSCNDGVQDSDETDVDCGGNACAGCEAGQVCNVNGDCASGICAYGVCQDPGGQP